MANWRNVDECDLGATISQAEIDAYRKDMPIDWSDPVERLLVRTVALVRGHIATNGKVSMGPRGTLPESLISSAMDYAAVDVLKRLDISVNEDRRRARMRAEELFERVSKGDFTPESYAEEDIASPTGGPAITVITTARARVSAAKLEGL